MRRTMRRLLYVVLIRHEIAETAAPLLPLRLEFLLFGGLRDFFSADRIRQLVEVSVRRVGRCHHRAGAGGEGRPVLPHKLDQLLVELSARRDDRVKRVRPDNEDAFVALYGESETSEQIIIIIQAAVSLTMKAAHCSLSARSKNAIESKI